MYSGVPMNEVLLRVKQTTNAVSNERDSGCMHAPVFPDNAALNSIQQMILSLVDRGAVPHRALPFRLLGLVCCRLAHGCGSKVTRYP